MDVNKLKELISQNEEIQESLQGCSDDLLMENISLILTALYPEDDVKPGYKIWLMHNRELDSLDWKYVPITEDTINEHKITHIERHYSLKLNSDFRDKYLLDLNKLNWIAGRDQLKLGFHKIIEAVKNGSIAIKGLWIIGEHGCGNTDATIAFLNHFANLGHSVSHIGIDELISITQNQFNANPFDKKESTPLEIIRTSDFLVLDNIGVERPTPWFKENMLLPLLDYRSKSNKTTLFVSNGSINKYKEKLIGRSQNRELEEDANNSIINKIRTLVSGEITVSGKPNLGGVK